MDNTMLENSSAVDIAKIIVDNVDQVYIVNSKNNTYRRVVTHGFMTDYIPESGSYENLMELLYFHIGETGERITDDYRVFMSSFGTYRGKYSRRLKITLDETTHLFQMTIYPVEGTDVYIFVLDELDQVETENELSADYKVSTIQNNFLFSMYIDLVKDTTGNINVSEISEGDMNNMELSYTNWRMMIVNMIFPDDRPLFLERTDPEYLKSHFAPGQNASFDCLMQNLEGKFIWVKLIFSRVETTHDDDYRFVFMVQDINDSTEELRTTLKQYEEKASVDPLTAIFNHGRIETEIANAIDDVKKSDSVIIMMLDIDFFKSVNDKHGHKVGDETLKHFAYVTNEYIRSCNGALGRWGGEEFVAVCYGIAPENAFDIAEKLRLKIEAEPFDTIGHITTSIGLSIVTKDDDVTSAFERIDKALYRAKSEGRNRVVMYDPSVD